MDDWGYGSWGMDRIAQWGMDRGMDRGVWIACGPGPLIHTLYFDLHPYIYIDKVLMMCLGHHHFAMSRDQLASWSVR